MKSFLMATALAVPPCSCSVATSNFTDTAPKKYAFVTPEMTAFVAGIQTFANPSQADQVIGPVTAFGCQKLASDPIPTEEHGVFLLKQQAATKCANAIASVSASTGYAA